MGWGDEVLVTARAAKLRAQTGRRAQVLDARSRPRWHTAWTGNPDIARRHERGAFVRFRDCGGHRPYILAETPQRWTWNYEHRASPGRIYLTRQEQQFAKPHAGRIILEPNIKASASPNKQWGWDRWNELARLLTRAGLRATQLGPKGTRLLEGAELVETPDIRRAAAVLALARAAVLPEGALHHVAAAFNVPAAVIFGGYIDPRITGYPFHANLFAGGEACGMRIACAHCRQAMTDIAPQGVFDALRALIEGSVAMKCHRGIWLPAGEVHLAQWMDEVNHLVDGKPTYQYAKLQAALRWVRSWRVAADVGAHCGLWSMHLVKRFSEVHAFEPVQAHRDCLVRNLGPDAKLRLHACALGERTGSVSIHTAPSSSGDSWVSGDGPIPMRTLDHYALAGVDFIKLDCEGYELFALRGAEETLKRCRPCVIVEQKPGRARKFGLPETAAVAYLQGLGAKLREVISGDYILSWE